LADMPNAMFYKRGRGLALHEVNIPAKIADLGKRASGGCTRLDPDTANNLFDLVKATEGATIPVIDESGNPVLDARGQLTYKNREVIIYGEGQRDERRMPPVRAYSALLIIQPDPVVALNPQFEQIVNFRFQPDQPFTPMINNY
ncbi:MAG: L,D-transpeptidase, partial [Bdellovibrionales bacterium]